MNYVFQIRWQCGVKKSPGMAKVLNFIHLVYGMLPSINMDIQKNEPLALLFSRYMIISSYLLFCCIIKDLEDALKYNSYD